MREAYEGLAQAYDHFMRDVDYDAWAQYLRKLIPRGVRRALEYACGTGNITQRLAAATRAEWIAVDRSEEMLMQAREKCAGMRGVRLICADMTEFVLEKPCDVALCVCDGVNYLTDEQKLQTFFRQVHDNLSDQGCFLFDISSAYKIKSVLDGEFFFDDAPERTVFWQNNYDAQSKCVQMDVTMFLAKGAVYNKYEETHIQRAWEHDEIMEHLSRAGFVQCDCYEAFTLDAPQPESQRIQFCARKDIK